MRWTAIMLAAALLVTAAGTVDAKPVRSNGGACDSTGTARRTGQDQNGNKMNCLWDTCTYSECSTSGGTIGNCVQKTEYSNPTDCHAASEAAQGTGANMSHVNGTLTLQPTRPVRPILPAGPVAPVKGLHLNPGNGGAPKPVLKGVPSRRGADNGTVLK